MRASISVGPCARWAAMSALVKPASSVTVQASASHARQPNSFIYRFVPADPSDLTKGGVLQALQVIDAFPARYRHWLLAGQRFEVVVEVGVHRGTLTWRTCGSRACAFP